ncbi:MAG: glutathione S-transferase N-terminal domain-containing protein [Pseudomonadales bacterium]|nr:glutathione S-transferase N-terminal domain-containing protein [Pseudomonadales bacterium]MCP5186054.1 glutathione S-transferase N-terminal domain-containing protein [Pseudomonadales bacterium]
MSERYQLFKFDSCPFCQRVLRFLAEHPMPVVLRDIHRDPQAWRELATGGGDTMVPCLRIEDDTGVRWLYESLDIIAYLQGRLSADQVAS